MIFLRPDPFIEILLFLVRLDTIASVFTVIGFCMIILKNRIGFLLGALGSGLYLLWAIPYSLPLVGLDAFFVVMNLVGYLKWKE